MNIRSSGDTFGKVAAHLRGSAAVPRSSSMRPDASDAVRAMAANMTKAQRERERGGSLKPSEYNAGRGYDG